MRYRYVPILKWKRGERRGIKMVSETMAQDVRPLIVVTEETFADQPETVRSEAMSASLLFADEVFQHWGAREFYLDASAIPPSPTGIHPLIETAKQCGETGAHMTPATRLAASPSYEAAVLKVAQTYDCGVALRVDVREFASASSWLPSWSHDPMQTDLILDLAHNVKAFSDLGPMLELAFRNLERSLDWRTVTVAGTSMPANFSEYETNGVHTIERNEWTLWQHLISLSLPYRLDYGDYATVAIPPPPADIGWGFPISVRYTLPTQFLICRGVRTRGEGAKDMDEQLIAHAKTIVRYKKRSRLDCWADETIDKIAAEEKGPEGLEHWVTIGVNRHIVRVRTDAP
jgi:hypothetical protein